MTEPGSSRSRPKGAYDVFLSFRGKDTRKNFTDHLYTALLQAGIYTFRDDNELPRGEEISKHLLEAIQESKISIVVFSKGYASSRWCLNELVEILECKKRNTDQILLPIFYDIDPSDVRKQTGSFAKAFDKHEERFKEKAKQWREALEEAGNLSGWNLNDMTDGHESRFIQKIIKEVLNKLDPMYLDVATCLMGIDPIVRDIRNFLSTPTDDVRMIGLHGMAGIGKTTIAKVVFNQLHYTFEGTCFLSNVAETSMQYNGLVLLQEHLLRDILKRNIRNINNVDRGISVIKERLRHKRVLVVFDDVDQWKQLNALMREQSWYGPGSRVIITTRNEGLLLKVDKKYEVKHLQREESIRLFSWHAFRDEILTEDYAELLNDVVDYSGGLPLALEVLGPCFSERNKSRWKCVIERLRKIPNHEIQEKLRIGFDTLDDDKLQNTFLDIACFFVGRRKVFVEKVLEVRCGFNPENDLETLIERSLMKINKFGEINMHDLLRDMGREISRKMSPDHPGKRNRIWHHEDAWSVLMKQMGTITVEGLALDTRASKVEVLNTKAFTEMKNLQLLKINGVHLIGSFKVLPKGLIWLCWHRCPLKSLPSDLELDNLVALDMQHSDIKELWKGARILNKLKILNLSYCENLARTPNFIGLFNLERLILKNCTSLVEVPKSIGYLKMLVLLNLEGCCRLKILSERICDVKSLESLNISGCSQLEKLPDRMGDIESLTELLADGIENEQLLSSILHCKYLIKLSLHGYYCYPDSPSPASWVSPIASWLSPRVLNWKALLPASLAGWSLLREINLGHCGLSEGATYCLDFGSLTCLEDLDLSGNRIFNLPSGIGHLPKLKALTVNDCEDLSIISDLPSSLSLLYAHRCYSLERVRLQIQSKTLPLLDVSGSRNLMDVEGTKAERNGLRVCSDNCQLFMETQKRRLAEAWSSNYYDHGYEVYFCNGGIPDWLSYRGEECSLSFHLPPFFQGLALWIVFDSTVTFRFACRLFINNKSNGIQLLKVSLGVRGRDFFSWVSYVRKDEMAMEDYCGEELELYLELWDEEDILYIKIKEIGVHVITEKLDSFEESSEWEWDRDIDNLQGTTSCGDVEEGDENDSQSGRDIVIPKLYHHLHHPLLGSIAFSTEEQWISHLLKELPAWELYFVNLWQI